MDESRRLSTKEKALQLNLDPQLYGSFAEIGAGQETAANFFKAGAASGTVAKTMSAYDMTFSDAIYGESDRYVSEERLQLMLNKEFGLLEKRLTHRKGSTAFFAFANTVETTNFRRTNDGHGWLGVRFQLNPDTPSNECVIHVVLHDAENTWQQRAIGIIGVNLLHSCFYLSSQPELFLRALLDGIIPGSVEIDLFRLTGPDFQHIDNRLMSLKLVKNGLTKTAMFGPDGSVLQPSETLYKKNVLVMSGRFRPFTKVHQDMLEQATIDFLNYTKDSASELSILLELSLNALIDKNGSIDDQDFLDRINILCSLGHTVMITNFLDYWYLVPYIQKANRKHQVGFVLSVRNIERIFKSDEYPDGNEEFLEAFSKLFGGKCLALAYPAYRKKTTDVITCNSLQVDAENAGLLRYLIDSKKLIDTGTARAELLQINMDEVLHKIQNNEPNWENSLPAEVVEQIKSNDLFGYKRTLERALHKKTEN